MYTYPGESQPENGPWSITISDHADMNDVLTNGGPKYDKNCYGCSFSIERQSLISWWSRE